MLDFGHEDENPYQEHIDRIEVRIRRLVALKDAQEPGSRHEAHFQRQINELTDALVNWEDTAPQLVKLDNERRCAQRQVQVAIRESVNTAGGWLRVAAVAGVTGGFAVLLSLAWTPSYLLPLCGIVLLVVAVASLVVGVRSRRDAEAAVADARDCLREVEQRRATLHPQQVALPTAEVY